VFPVIAGIMSRMMAGRMAGAAASSGSARRESKSQQSPRRVAAANQKLFSKELSMAYEVFRRGSPDVAEGRRLYVRDSVTKQFIGFVNSPTDSEWNGAVNSYLTPVAWTDDAPGPSSRLVANGVPPGWIYVSGIVRGW
jgi:hypothetical protein